MSTVADQPSSPEDSTTDSQEKPQSSSLELASARFVEEMNRKKEEAAQQPEDQSPAKAVKKTKPVTLTTCPKCSEESDWEGNGWCPICGYHPELKTTFEVAQETNEDDEEVQWQELVPAWAWILLAGVVGIVIGSIIVGLSLSTTGFHSLIGLLVGVVGFLTAIICHLAAYFRGVSRTDKYGPVDLAMKPFGIWKDTLNQLPRTGYHVQIFAWGITLTLCGPLLIGGAEKLNILDAMKVEKRPKINIVSAVASAVPEEEMSMEDALEEAAGGAETMVKNSQHALDDEKGEDELLDEQQAIPLIQSECMIMGYTLSAKDQIQSLILASKVDRRVKYVGVIWGEDLERDVELMLIDELRSLRRPYPIAICPHEARWVSPKLKCTIGHTEWTASHKLVEPQFLEMVDETHPSSNESN